MSMMDVPATKPPQKASSKWIGLVLLIGAKAKLALFMLFKMWTFFASLLFYSLIFGWRFALLFLIMLAIHELGHYVVMRRLGVDASLPAFIPGLGALIFTKTMHTFSRYDQALVGIAGPFAGTAAAILFWVIGTLTQQPIWIAAAYTGFFLNLFNLLPVPPLDGSKVIQIISDRFWALGIVAFAALCWFVPTMRNPFVIIIVLLSLPSVGRAWRQRNNTEIEPTPLKDRLVFLALYFAVAGIDAGGMIATHLRTSAG
jgi:Zn-dependent protease